MDVSEPTPAQRVQNGSDLVGVIEAAEEFDVACCCALGMSHPAFDERTQSGCHRRLWPNFLSDHISKLVNNCYYHLRQIRSIRRSLTIDSTHALVRALVLSRIDYCNSLLGGISGTLLSRLDGVMRAAARLVLQLQYRDHVTTLIRDRLHWLDAASRITYKLCVLVFCCRNGLAPRYLVEHCIPVATIPGRSNLRSAAAGELCIPRCLTATLGPRAFAVSGPSSWNSLPSDLREPGISLATFKKLLKTVLFRQMPLSL